MAFTSEDTEKNFNTMLCIFALPYFFQPNRIFERKHVKGVFQSDHQKNNSVRTDKNGTKFDTEVKQTQEK